MSKANVHLAFSGGHLENMFLSLAAQSHDSWGVITYNAILISAVGLYKIGTRESHFGFKQKRGLDIQLQGNPEICFDVVFNLSFFSFSLSPSFVTSFTYSLSSRGDLFRAFVVAVAPNGKFSRMRQLLKVGHTRMGFSFSCSSVGTLFWWLYVVIICFAN